jgi:integrase
VVAHHAGQQDRRLATEDGMAAADPARSRLGCDIGAAKREHISILTTMFGRPFTVDGFSQWMRDAITEAGLPLGCRPHGLRKATGRRLAEDGATAKMIMSVLGHTTLAEAERYTEEADQAGLAEDAVVKLEGHKANRFTQTTTEGLGRTSKSKENSK